MSLDLLARDVRLAVRRLLRRPGYTATALLILGLGVGFAVALAAVHRALFERPLPYPDPDRLVAVLATYADKGVVQEIAASGVDLLGWREARSVAALGAETPRDLAVLIGDRVESLRGDAVSASLLSLLGAAPAAGRLFTAEEDAAGADVALLSDRLWTRLGRDPGIVGAVLRIDGRPHVVVGIMPPAFTTLFQESALFVPLGISPANPGLPGRRTLAITARLAPGETIASAESELAAIASRLGQERPASHRGWSVRVKPLREQYLGDRRPVFRLLLAGIAAVLLIGAANLAHLALEGASARRGELVIRAALGGTRSDHRRGELVESLLLGAGGAVAGLAIAAIATPPLLRLDAELARLAGEIRIELRSVALAIGLGWALAGVATFLPAIAVNRGGSAVGASRTPLGSRKSTRFRQAMLAIEVALSLVLLVGSGVLIRGLVTAMTEHPGFETGNLVAAQLVLPADRYREAASRRQLVAGVIDRLRTVPGVTAATTSMTRFRPEMSMQASIVVEGAAAEESAPDNVHFRRISPDYLATMGARLIAGREISDRDGADDPRVAMISESMARRYWPGQEPLGRRVRRVANRDDWITIVGVLADIRDGGAGFDLGSVLFVPYAQSSVAGVSWAPVTILVRSRLSEGAAGAAIQSAVTALDPDLAVEPPALVERQLGGALARHRLQAALLGGFGIAALALVIAGLYGVTAYGVAQRRPEIGIRIALGSSAPRIWLLVLVQTAIPLLLGGAAGSVAAVGAARAAGRLLPVESAPDPVLIAGLATGLMVIGVAAALGPAIRAGRVEPMEAMGG